MKLILDGENVKKDCRCFNRKLCLTQLLSYLVISLAFLAVVVVGCTYERL